MAYKAIAKFKDLQDKNETVYSVGDVFPSGKQKQTQERIKELTSKNNRLGYAVIKEVEEKEETPKTKPKTKINKKDDTNGKGKSSKAD